ncbi:ABC transporter ATP-binding protein [Campylobacter canadensis]|uniref:ABC transporter ATP-binding protein n=1 Tax=Campylobacter canadensis TaxID=449520 RepID=A0ABS7WSF3_9BACT|nr:ABC transporter ATP-binding protein [Campylobacter canadensis]MBZ7987691.1 ABC transporter ATP-binding protein [Campylobacter canadensis]MBZ7994986.1 ABC transporter ATP-binding protein [Campylobacter canadensis]MBZ7996928.1 ABC transporter ATP-binding protein [Campylobacter canadensis]MBZ7998772.1 ABC transporter ATP-binding protein [Campylobacter canadensis]MBZ8000407.1 ABC transporter ATP-binding protein [Campylobacter canadensis]
MIKVCNLYKSFDKANVLKDINFSLEKGKWLSIVGKSGSGKTTLLNILSMLDNASSGEYYLDGVNVLNLSQHDKQIIRREKIGLIFQQFHLIPYLSVLENVMLAQYYHSSTDKDDAISILDKVGLKDRLNHLPSELSGGQQQRLCIARSLINNPQLLLADEPTGNLDEENGNIVLEIFKRLRNEGKTIVLITHNPDLAQNADKIITIKDGVLSNE